MEDCLLLSQDSRGSVRFKGQLPAADKELSPILQSNIVANWLNALGGPALNDHGILVFSKDLKTGSLPDLRQRISNNLDTLITEA